MQLLEKNVKLIFFLTLLRIIWIILVGNVLLIFCENNIFRPMVSSLFWLTCHLASHFAKLYMKKYRSWWWIAIELVIISDPCMDWKISRLQQPWRPFVHCRAMGNCFWRNWESCWTISGEFITNGYCFYSISKRRSEYRFEEISWIYHPNWIFYLNDCFYCNWICVKVNWFW